MFLGFSLVAMQMCTSPYILDNKVGLFALSQKVSSVIHYIFAVIGFGCLIYWTTFCFTKTNIPKEKRTTMKRRRNKVYYTFRICMIASLLLFVINALGLLGSEFPIIFVAECCILCMAGISCLIKSGMFLKDKK
jgi:amino acid permease